MCETNNSEWKRCILSIRNSIDNCVKTTRIKPNFASLNELKIIQGTIDGILNSRENKKRFASCFLCFPIQILQHLFVDLLRRQQIRADYPYFFIVNLLVTQ